MEVLKVEDGGREEVLRESGRLRKEVPVVEVRGKEEREKVLEREREIP